MFCIRPSAMQLLLHLYNSPQRHYHDQNHIQYCISKLAEYTANNKLNRNQIITLTYAIWFHDAIYSPYSFHNMSSNESESRLLFSAWLDSEPVDSQKILNPLKSKISEAIHVTEFHLLDMSTDTLHPTSLIMLDIDLSEFTKPLSEVMKDSDRILAEYECLGIPLNIMLENRIEFLNKLLSKNRIFYTDYFYNKYEAGARNNIAASIEATKKQLSSHI